MNRQQSIRRKFFAGAFLAVAFIGVAVYLSGVLRIEKVVQAEDTATLDAEIEAATFTKTEFFGAQAIVPFPTATARDRIAKLTEKYPNEPKIRLKLASLNEQIGDYAAAERDLNRFVELNQTSQNSLEELTNFYNRRARFEAAAETLEKILKIAKPENRVETFGRLIELARVHKLEKYLKPDFQKQFAAENPASFPIVNGLIEKFVAEKNFDQALTAIRSARQNFPENRLELFAKEIEILQTTNRAAEAETIYHQAFDLFWSDAETEKYYQFLSEQDRLRAYGRELRDRFKQNPTDFAAATRLFDYKKYNDYDTAAATAIFTRLERARAETNVQWQPEELLTAARLLIRAGDGDQASRFLYTLLRADKLPETGELRRKILYQLFEILHDAGTERIALTDGSLDFYRDVAQTDLHPGIATGVLSLIFSDANPARELQNKEATATKMFNRAAALRVFQIYKLENQTSPELAQMYLDTVRLHADANEPEIADQILREFEARPEFANQTKQPKNYSIIALKLADAFVAVENQTRARQVYQRVLDFLGKRQIVQKQPLIAVSDDAEPSEKKPTVVEYPSGSNPGIKISSNKSDAASNSYDNGSPASAYTDFFAAETGATYEEVLNRLVASLARENKTAEILILYRGEIAKYPTESGLYEQQLQWLGQTNLVDQQFAVYQTALKQFPDTSWQDRLARWFLRHKRAAEFEKFSGELLEKLGDDETKNYLAQFVDRNAAANFDQKLYLQFYQQAHRRFPHNLHFVNGLLGFYQTHKQTAEWRALVAEYYFESAGIREAFLSDLAARGELREFQRQATEKSSQNVDLMLIESLPYKQFRADAAARLSNFEEAVSAYRELNQLYPHNQIYADKLIALSRSLGQINPNFLNEAATVARNQADFTPFSADNRTRAGEIYAEAADYNQANEQWRKIVETGRGEAENYRTAATVFWDYFQYDDALGTIRELRRETNDSSIYAFETAAILEAKNDVKSALGEYVKALDGATPEHENVQSSDRAKDRLETLHKRGALRAQIQAAFETERAGRTGKNRQNLVLGYADFLRRAADWKTGGEILRREIAASSSEEFLIEARELCDIAEDKENKRFALERLAQTATQKRALIKYNFRLADNLSETNDQPAAAAVLNRLVKKFPKNHIVLTNAANFYWKIGRRAEAVETLQNAFSAARGNYRVEFGRRLAARFEANNQFVQAETVLEQLRLENKFDYGIFNNLAKIYVKTGERQKLEAMFAETLSVIKQQNINFRDIDMQIAELRTAMIASFTKLGDYPAAIRQHIEIINREPENPEYVEAAIDYARRRGGADVLLDYYKETAGTANKNYRWFVVLARIYEAKGDFANAAENYRVAIINQPEMLELYDALAAVYERQNNLNQAIETVGKTLELSNDEPARVRRLIKLLEKAGRSREAAAAREKLPTETAPKLTLAEEFARAAELKSSAKTEVVEIMRRAFDALEADPLAHEIKTSDIKAFVQTVRSAENSAENLDKIFVRLWDLRRKLSQEIETANSVNAGKASAQRTILNNAIVESIGETAAKFATGAERAALLAELEKRLEGEPKSNQETLTLVQNLTSKAGFDQLEEKILMRQKDEARSLDDLTAQPNRLNALLNFYRERGDFAKVLNLLETERARGVRGNFDFLPQIIETAGLLNETEKELTALREYFAKSCKDCSHNAPDKIVRRYLEVLAANGDAGRNELRELAGKPTAYQFQLINFLLEKGDAELARTAIENSNFGEKWKSARRAETGFALGGASAATANYFAEALRIQSIGELIKQKPQPETQITGDDWFRLTNVYGKFLTREQSEKATQYLPAQIENRPREAGEQAKLGAFYLGQKNHERAIEHLRLALEIDESDNGARANLGAAYFLQGDQARADEIWAEIITGDDPPLADFEVYLKTLAAHNRADAARQKLALVVAKQLEKFDAQDKSEIYSEIETEKFESIAQKIRLLAESFADYKNNESVARRQAAFFEQFSRLIKANGLLPELLLEESLIANHERQPFYELLLEPDSGEVSGRDYNFTALLETAVDERAAEIALDAKNSFEPEEPTGARIKRQAEFLTYLLKYRRFEAAQKLIADIEKSIAKRYARPAWLRLAKLQIKLAANQTAQQTLPEFKTFTGVFDEKIEAEIVPPSVERLNQAVELLKSANRSQEAEDLQIAVYARLLWLENFDAASFAALAETAFKRGDAKLGNRILGLMTKLADETERATAAAELHEIEWIKRERVAAARVAEDAAENSLNINDALRIAAEIAARFEQFEAAIEFRQKLRIVDENNQENQIELARLLNYTGRFADALPILIQTIGNRETTRAARWQAIFVTAEICGDKPELWAQLNRDAANALADDDELRLAGSALELERTNRAAAARKLLNDSEIAQNNEYLRFINGLFAAGQNDFDGALQEFQSAAKIGKNADFSQAFGFAAAEPSTQIIKFFAETNRSRAALRLAEQNQNWNKAADFAAENGFQSLTSRRALREIETRLTLLELLSAAAEESQDFERAAEFAQAQNTLLKDQAEKQVAEARINDLRERAKSKNRRATDFQVNRNLVSSE